MGSSFTRLLMVATLFGCGPGDDPGTGGADGGAGAVDGGADAGAAHDAAGRDGGGPSGDAGHDGGRVELPACEVLAAFERSALAAPAADSGGYVVPDGSALEAFEAAVRAAAEGALAEARAQASVAGYSLCRGEGDEEGLILLAPLPPSRGWARVVLRTGAARALILEAPHPLYDLYTLEESVLIFVSLGARALVASGTHRCANPVPSGCDGTTGACGSTAPYRESDVAHAVDSMFHRAHVGLASVFTADVVISVHGMGQAGVSLSDGTTGPVDAEAPVARIASALVAAGVAGVTACNEGAGVTVEGRLCGTTNVQGRHLNGSPNACTARAPSAAGRFVHMEQARSLREAPAPVVAALDAALP